MGRDGTGRAGTGWDGTGWDGMGWDGTGRDGTGWDGTGRDGTGWDGTGREDGRGNGPAGRGGTGRDGAGWDGTGRGEMGLDGTGRDETGWDGTGRGRSFAMVVSFIVDIFLFGWYVLTTTGFCGRLLMDAHTPNATPYLLDNLKVISAWFARFLNPDSIRNWFSSLSQGCEILKLCLEENKTKTRMLREMYNHLLATMPPGCWRVSKKRLKVGFHFEVFFFFCLILGKPQCFACKGREKKKTINFLFVCEVAWRHLKYENRERKRSEGERWNGRNDKTKRKDRFERFLIWKKFG